MQLVILILVILRQKIKPITTKKEDKISAFNVTSMKYCVAQKQDIKKSKQYKYFQKPQLFQSKLIFFWYLRILQKIF